MKKFKLIDYIDKISEHGLLRVTPAVHKLSERLVEKVSYDSNNVSEGTLFVCKGLGFQEQYLDMAIANGVFAYVSETDYGKEIPCIQVTEIQKVLSLVSNIYFDYPWKKLKLIGVTATKGKSTTSYYVKYILDDYLTATGQKPCGIISSINTYDGITEEESHITTPESLDLQQHFYNAVQSGLTYMVSEVSSQAMKYGRLYDVSYDVGAYLNISEDHISPIEHVDFEDYFQAKLSYFSMCKSMCINLDSDHADRVIATAKQAPRVVSFSAKAPAGADLYGYNIHKEGFDTVFCVRGPGFDREFRLSMPGLFNVENALAAIAICLELKIPLEHIIEGLYKAKSSGRMEVFMSKGQEKIVIVDYAHNKLSFEKLYESTKNEYAGREIITIFGCPGGKAYLRRHDLGLLAGMHSDRIYLTAEDPAMEDPRVISEEIATHVRVHSNNYKIIDDRGEAIRDAIMTSSENCIILVTGKGNEKRQKFGKEYIPCPSDVDYAIEYLAEYDRLKDEAAVTI